MHYLSQPPSDRDVIEVASSPVLAGDELRNLVRATGASRTEIGVGIRRSKTLVSQWLNNKYPADASQIELELREWLRDRNVAKRSGVETIDTDVSTRICEKIEDFRRNAELGLIIAPAGIGKTRAGDMYIRQHSLAIAFRCVPWHSGMSGLADDLCHAAQIGKAAFKHARRWDVIIERTKGSGRPLIVDDAHELSHRGLQCVVDYHELTGNPVILIGLESLIRRLKKDDRRARRVSEVFTLSVREPEPLVKHMLRQLAPDCGEETTSMIPLCLQVVRGNGCFGSLEKQLQLAAALRERKIDRSRLKPEDFLPNGKLRWVAAFRAAHLKLLRILSLN